jgi:hypothetical protein
VKLGEATADHLPCNRNAPVFFVGFAVAVTRAGVRQYRTRQRHRVTPSGLKVYGPQPDWWKFSPEAEEIDFGFAHR